GVAVAALGALAVSVARRRAGVSRQHADHDRRTARVAAMTGIERNVPASPSSASLPPAPTRFARQSVLRRHRGARRGRGPRRHAAADRAAGPEFPPVLDIVAPAIGVIGLVAAGVAAGGNDLLAVARTLAGAAFLGAVTDAMLLGHWYLVQPGL